MKGSSSRRAELIELSVDQQDAMREILAALLEGDRIMVLTGPGGTGKTTLVRQLSNEFEALGRFVRFSAPTGKAAYRLTEVTGHSAMTLHSLLYSRAIESYDWDEVKKKVTRKLEFSGQQNRIGPKDIVIVDEASMVGTRLHKELLSQTPEGAVILYVGDREQLSPVNDKWGPDFDRPTAWLSTIHRQAADNPIIQISKEVRLGGKLPRTDIDGKYFWKNGQDLDNIVDWMADKHIMQSDAVVLCYTRHDRALINQEVRKEVGYVKDLQIGDRLKVALNNYRFGRMNGEIVRVIDIQPFDGALADEVMVTVEAIEPGMRGENERTKAICQSQLIGEPPSVFHKYLEALDRKKMKSQYLHFDWGYCITIHSSQGSEWQDIAFAMTLPGLRSLKARAGSAELKRLVYTAVTRAADTLTVFPVERDWRSIPVKSSGLAKQIEAALMESSGVDGK